MNLRLLEFSGYSASKQFAISFAILLSIFSPFQLSSYALLIYKVTNSFTKFNIYIEHLPTIMFQ